MESMALTFSKRTRWSKMEQTEIRVGADILEHERIKARAQDSNDPFVAYTFSESERKQAARSSNTLAYYAVGFCDKSAQRPGRKR